MSNFETNNFLLSKKDFRFSIFFNIVKNALEFFPQEAHIKILNFLQEINVDTNEIEAFKTSWSRVILANEAFGRKNQPIRPEIFASEFINEFGKKNENALSLKELTEQLQTISQEIHNLGLNDITKEISDSDYYAFTILTKDFDTIYNEIKDSASKVFPMPQNYEIWSFKEQERNTNILETYKESISNVKMIWRKNELIEYKYYPFDFDFVGKPKLRIGKLSMSTAAKKNYSFPLFYSTDDIIGVHIQEVEPIAWKNAWNSFAYLYDMIPMKLFNIFPKPLDFTRVEMTPTVIFGFENPQVQEFNEFVGVDFSNLIRKYPTILKTWCVQLVYAVRMVSLTKGLAMFDFVHTRNIFITNEGLLLFGGIGFMEEEEVDYSECGGLKNSEALIPTIYKILGTALSTSRIEYLVLSELENFNSVGTIFENTRNAFVDDFYEGFQTGFLTYTLTAGSSIDFKILADFISDVKIRSVVDTYGMYPKEPFNPEDQLSLLNVVYKIDGEYKNSPIFSGECCTKEDDDCDAILKIQTFDPCVIYLEFTNFVFPSDQSKTYKRRNGCIRLSVIAKPPTHSVEILELIGYLEEYYLMRKSSIIFNTIMLNMERAEDIILNEDKSKSLIVETTAEWGKFKKEWSTCKVLKY